MGNLFPCRGVDAPLRKIHEGTPGSRWGPALLTLTLLLAASGAIRVSQAKAPLTLEGRLGVAPGIGALLRTRGKDRPLAGKTPFISHTLEDKRLLNRDVRLEGTERPDGAFEVERLYTLHNGKLYRIRYFCEICNIEALEPGDCVCCQQPTELQEIPVNEMDKEILITR